MIEKEETIDPEIRDVVTSLGKLIAASLAESTEGNSEKYGFCLLMFTQGDPSDVVLSISNVDRPEMFEAMKEFIARNDRPN